jgi:hypothetical protein
MLLLSKKNHVGTHDAWAAAWGLDLGTPPCAHVVLGLLPKAHTWRFGHASVLGTPLCIYIWCLDCLLEGLANPAHVVLGLIKTQLFLDLGCCNTQISLRFIDYVGYKIYLGFASAVPKLSLSCLHRP